MSKPQLAFTSTPVSPLKSPHPEPQAVKVSIRNLSFYYGKALAIQGASLDVPLNRVTAFIGPSGCGKSTFLRTLNRMYETIPGARAEGQILLDGADVMAMEVTELRRRIGMVFQKSNPFPKSIYENVAFGLRLNGARGRRLDDAVEQSLVRAALWNEVKDKLHKSAYDLSGGQQQRLSIARTLAVSPEVLLLDEPCSALDPIATAKIEELLYELKKVCTIVIVTHNMQQASRTSDFTGFFLTGKLVEFNNTKILFETPTQSETEDYITGRFG